VSETQDEMFRVLRDMGLKVFISKNGEWIDPKKTETVLVKLGYNKNEEQITVSGVSKFELLKLLKDTVSVINVVSNILYRYSDRLSNIQRILCDPYENIKSVWFDLTDCAEKLQSLFKLNLKLEYLIKEI
jgi:hypothetical protein